MTDTSNTQHTKRMGNSYLRPRIRGDIEFTNRFKESVSFSDRLFTHNTLIYKRHKRFSDFFFSYHVSLKIKSCSETVDQHPLTPLWFDLCSRMVDSSTVT